MIRVAVVCEARSDMAIACALADRVITESTHIERSTLDSHRSWCGVEDGTSFVAWKDIKRLTDARKIRRAHGKMSGVPLEEDAWAARNALRMLHDATPRPDAVLLIRDSDGHASRKRGLEQARTNGPFSRVLLAVPNPKREAWVLIGFVGRDGGEDEQLAAMRRELTLDPTREPERLNAREPGALRNIKRVVDVLTAGSPDRESDCWLLTELGLLRQYGRAVGLTGYLEEVGDRLVPLLAPDS